MTSTAPPAPAVTVTPRRAKLALAVLLAGMFMALLDTTIVNVALPTIRDSLNASEATLTWIIAGYALAYGLALIPAGRFGDRFGHKWVFFAGLALFTVASLAAGLAQDETQLVVARAVQGLGGGIFFPPVTAFIQLLFPPAKRGVAFAVMGATIGVSTALGPIVGGLLIQALGEESGWRWIFVINLPIGVLALIAAAVLLPAGAEGKKLSTDLLGLVLLSGALVAILVPLIQGQDEGWPLWTYLSIAGGVVLVVLFALWERAVAARGTEPLVPPHLFSHRAFTGGVILALVYFAAFTSIFFAISIFWQAGLGHTALEAGLVSTPFAIGSIVGASQSDRLAERLGRAVLTIGVALLAVGLIALWLIMVVVPTADLTAWALLGPMLVAGFGSGLFIAPNARFIVATVDRTEAGAASGVIGTMQRIGSAIGIAVIGSILFGIADLDSVGADIKAGMMDGTFTNPDLAASSVLAAHFGPAATAAIAVSAVFAVVAFALTFTLPKRVALH
jgi:EmrB/QacA subfamily drug resistance transporter